MAILSGLRQLQYYREFRIRPARAAAGIQDVLAKLEEIAEAAAREPREARPRTKDEKRFLAEMSTGLWRLKQKMVRPGTDHPLEETAMAYRHLESVWDVLSEAGIKIQDHTGRPYDSGLSLEVLAFQPTPGIERERIIETISPSVYLDGEPIQRGTVIVGTKEEPAD